MKSFHGKKEIKAEYLARVRAHIAADEVVQGHYWEGGKGCAVGCTIHSDDHNAYEKELGIPEWLAHVQDRLFEGMSNAHAKTWPEEFLEAIPVGIDLEQVKNPFMVIVLEHALKTVQSLKGDFKRQEDAIQGVLTLYERGSWSAEEMEKARADADYAGYVAAAYAAYAAADAAAYAAAAAYGASAAADAAAYAAAAYADAGYAHARADAYKHFADELIKLLKDLA